MPKAFCPISVSCPYMVPASTEQMNWPVQAQSQQSPRLDANSATPGGQKGDMAKANQAQLSPTDNTSSLKCPICSKVFNKVLQLNMHLAKHQVGWYCGIIMTLMIMFLNFFGGSSLGDSKNRKCFSSHFFYRNKHNCSVIFLSLIISMHVDWCIYNCNKYIVRNTYCVSVYF